jgi:hypothetical protein
VKPSLTSPKAAFAESSYIVSSGPYREPVPYPEVTLRPLGFRARMLVPLLPAIVLAPLAIVGAIVIHSVVPEVVPSTFGCRRTADVVTCESKVDGRVTSHSAKRDEIHVTQHHAKNGNYECMSFGSQDVYCNGPASVVMTPVMALQPGEQFLWDTSQPLRGSLMSMVLFVWTTAFVVGAAAFAIGLAGRGPRVHLRVTPLTLEGAPTGPMRRPADEMVQVRRVGPSRTFSPRFAIDYGSAAGSWCLGEWRAYGAVELEPMANALRAALARVLRQHG